MKKSVIIVTFLCAFISLSAQTSNTIVLKNVGLDSLKRVVERSTDYKLYFVEDRAEEPVRISVTSNGADLVFHLSSALSGVGYTLSQMGDMLYVLKKTGILTKLPDQFFASQEEQGQDSVAYMEVLTAVEKTATSENKVYTIGDPNFSIKGNRAILTGVVKNMNTGEPVSDVVVSVSSTGAYAFTDIHGFYRIALPLGRADILLSGLGFEDNRLMLDVFADGNLDVVMKENAYSLRSITVSAEATQHSRTTQIGVEKLQINRIKHIPTVFGEADVIKVVLTLPGVKSVGESSGGFNVRGGATDQNLILFNEGTIYNPTHLFGLFSSFNPDVVSDIELYKSTIPAKYGGRISSILEVNSRNGNNNKITGSAGIGLLTSKLHLEGPIVKEKTNFIIGARTTYSDWLLGLLPENSGYRDGSARFYDITAGLSQKINHANTLYLYGYYSADQFSFSKDTVYNYSNINVALKWRSILNAKHTMTLSMGYDEYKHAIKETANPVDAYNMNFQLKQFFAKANFDWLINEKHTLNYGLNAVYFNLSPGTLAPIGGMSEVLPEEVAEEHALEAAIFASDTWHLSDKLSVDLGVRYTLYSAMGPATYYKYSGGEMSESSITDTVTVGKGAFIKPYQRPEFRLSARYSFNSDFTIKTGFNTMRQNIHMLSNTASVSPIDTWKLSDANIVPQTGWQLAAGVYKNFFDRRLEVSLEGYYKATHNYLDYKSGAVLNMNQHIEWDVLETEGKAYGVELMLKKPTGKLNGWVAYSYSRTLLKEQGDKEVYQINGGDWYPAAYDKPHDVKVVMNYKFTQRYSISANLDYATGRPVTIPVSTYYYGGGYRLEYSDRNGCRIPDYFRLDLAFNIEPSHNLKLWTHSVLTFGVYNVTGRENAFSVYYSSTEGKKIQGYQLSIFGAPIPYINYTIKF